MRHRLDKLDINFIYNPAYRAIGAQVLLLVFIFLIARFFIHNAATNLEEQGIASGFDFLNNPAGFDVIQSLIPYKVTDTYMRMFYVGLLNTILLSSISIILASLVGLIMGIARLSSNWLVAKLATVYIEIFRNVPLLLQIFFWYFAVLRILPTPRASVSILESIYLNNRGLYIPKPIFTENFHIFAIGVFTAFIFCIIWYKMVTARQRETGQRWPVALPCVFAMLFIPGSIMLFFTGIPWSLNYPQLSGFNFSGGLVIIPELIAMVLGLTIYTGTFIAETVRGGILAVPKGQIEAAQSLGLKKIYRLQLIILPQALRVIIPPMCNQYCNIIKNSSLAAAIAYPDLVAVYAGTVLNQTGQAIEVIAMTMAFYLTTCLTVSLLMNLFNRKMALVER